MTMLEEAEKRDHRRLGRELDLFHIDEHAPGTVFWHPKGWTVWQEVEQYMRRVYRDNGYHEVKGPQILDKTLWEKTGHWPTTARTCSSRSRKSATTRSSR
jgi:threonyl-tRNA synthetase